MKSDRVMLWRFAAAPKELRALHSSTAAPEWLVLVPRSLSGADLDQAISAGAEPGQLARYETSTGDVVYVGNSPIDRTLHRLAGSIQPAATATAATRRK